MYLGPVDTATESSEELERANSLSNRLSMSSSRSARSLRLPTLLSLFRRNNTDIDRLCRKVRFSTLMFRRLLCVHGSEIVSYEV
jgi:hypothetical protein